MKALTSTLLFIFVATLIHACSSPPANDENNRLTLDDLDPEISEMLGQISADTLEKNIYRLADFGTRHTLSETEDDQFGIGAARRWIKAEMERYSSETGGRLEVEFHSYMQEATNRIPEEVEIVNVIGTLPGSDPDDDRIFVVSGHYDSRATGVMDAESEAPGANDDASGTAAVMEMARVMSAYQFPATIVFMAVAGEEQGLLGARRWAEEAHEQGLNIAGMITNDIIGNHAAEDGALTDPNRVRLFAQGIPVTQEPDRELLRYIQTGGENDLPTRQLARTIKEVSESYLPDMEVWMIYRADRYLRGGDHMPFLDLGYPAVRFSEPHEEFKHQHQDIREEDGVQYGDLPEFVDYPYVARVTHVNLAALANLARAPQEPRDVGMNISRLENDTRLRWEASPSAHVAGYEVLWRETTSPVWQHKDFTTDTSYTAELLSKDNYLFGVRAVSEGGHVSSTVYPFPFRE
ncbi:MAG: M28 family metallopeptidase [Balneolaceae bacterium]|nr:M28 family metallopeptidase [Balneolaceae bacterium]MCH8549897.1 M28 family metallopeptidase [Balneolaceae bacterium]